MDSHSFFEVKKIFSRGDRHVLTVLSNFQSDVVFREFSIGNPIVRLKKDFLGSGARNRAVTPGENSTPELIFLKIVFYDTQVSPAAYKSSEITLETLETRNTSKNDDILMLQLWFS